MERESFIFYRSFYDAIRDLPRDIQGEIYTAIMEYGLYGNETESLKPVARSIFTLIKPILDANNTRFENGSKGGRPKKEKNLTETKPKPKHNLTETKPKPNKDVDVNVDNNNIITETTSTRACEEKIGMDDVHGLLLGDQQWLDVIAIQHHITLGEIPQLLDHFVANCIANGQETHKNIADIKFHFNNWLRKQPTNNQNNGTPNQTIRPVADRDEAKRQRLADAAELIARKLAEDGD